MSRKFMNILKLYLYNPIFLILASIYFIGAFISRAGIHYGISGIAEDMMTMVFVFSVWLAFVFGVLIKRQFANHRSSLLPRYRSAHLTVAILIYFAFLVTACLWERGTVPNPILKITSAELTGIYLTCLFMSILIIYFGYLSIGIVLFLAYFVVLVMAGQSQFCIDYLGESPNTRMMLAGSTIALILFFGYRLVTLKEEMFEYSFMFSWPQKDFVRNQLKATQIFADATGRLKSVIGIKSRHPAMPTYPRAGNLISRARHWDFWDRQETTLIIILMILVTPFYMEMVRHPFLHNFYKNPYANFLFYSIAPVLITVCGRYKQMAYLSYDLLKPVRKAQFMKERGAVLLQDFLVYWMLFVIYFAVGPNQILQPEVLATGKFWSYLFLTFSYGIMSLAWIAYMAALTSTRSVIINGILSCSLTQVEFMVVGYLPMEVMVINALVCAAGGVVLTVMAYQRWCGKELA